MIKILLTVYAGLEHAFEADHLLAVNQLVSERDNFKKAIKDGVYWGIGHTATIFFIGILMILFKMHIDEHLFSYFEAAVGLMLIFLGIYRLYKLSNPHFHLFKGDEHHHNSGKAAFGVGLVHGLAGSGALVVLVISQMDSALDGLMYILIFGLGSIIGMFIAAYLFSLPYTKLFLKSKKFQSALVIVSSLLCMAYGTKVFAENMGWIG